MRRQLRKTAAALVAVTALAGLGAAAATAASSSSASAKAGGTYRVGWEQSFGFTNAFDPTGEYLGEAFSIYSNLLVRTLVGYNHVAGAAGNTLVPDLATAVPAPTNGGKTYSFTLKSGIKFAPPVNRAITSADIKYAFERLANPKDGGQYAFYYTEIAGWDAYAKGTAKTISGITTPAPNKIVFNLTKPVGDFLYRASMPATGPIPVEVAKCFEGKPGAYGRNLVSSGPYMIEGSDAADISSCTALKPFSGFDGQTKMNLVRNPNYNAATDSKAARENNPDRFEFVVNSNADDIYNRIKNGDLEDNVASPTPKVLREYTTNPSLKSKLHLNSGDRTWYITLNLTQPPFDDIHIRKAMSWVMDKQGLRKAWGGPTAGDIATHVVPDPLLFDKAKGFDPYATPNNAGDVNKAMAEIKLSKYDTNKDGKCDAKECSGVLLITDTRSVDKGMTPVLEASAKKIGITFTVRAVNGAYPVIQTPAKNVPISERPGWGKDYADPLTFFQALFTSGAIIKQGNTNYSLLGITPEIAKAVGATGKIDGVPSVDADFDKCSALVGDPRVACWVALDKKLMTDVVNWIPYLWSYAVHVQGPKVTKWEFDQFGGSIGYAHVAVS